MYPKFIINQDGVLRFGQVFLHRDLLGPGEQCVYGGGLWKLRYLPDGTEVVHLYGRSFDFGPPCFDSLRRIDWSGLWGKPMPLFFVPHWPDESELQPVFVART